jgi:hypothetical protein
MLDWLFAGKIGEWHEIVNVQTREKDTGAWFLVMEDFRKWINREIPWLNCQGNRKYLRLLSIGIQHEGTSTDQFDEIRNLPWILSHAGNAYGDIQLRSYKGSLS